MSGRQLTIVRHSAYAMLLVLLLTGEQSRVIYDYILSGGHVKRAMPAGYYDFSNDTELIGAATFTVFLHLSLLFLIFRLAFAEPAKRFFNNSEPPRPQKGSNRVL